MYFSAFVRPYALGWQVGCWRSRIDLLVSKLLHILARGVLGFPEGSTRLLLGSGGPSFASLAWALVGFSRFLWHHYRLLELDPQYYLQASSLGFSVGDPRSTGNPLVMSLVRALVRLVVSLR